MTITGGELTTIAMCWRIERLDGAGIALTSHDRSISVDGATCDPAPGMMPASVKRRLGLEPHSAEVAGALSADALDESDLALGRWNGADVRLSAADWSEPGTEPIDLISGTLGNVALSGESFSAELQGAAVQLERPVCPATSAECRAQFGDKQCRVDLAGRTISAAVVASSDGMLTLDQEVDLRFLLGRIRYLDGSNCGLATVILAVDGATISIRDLARAPVEAGCRVSIREGCDKRFETCVQRFANADNFRGEPHLPGNDLLTRYPGA